MLLQTLRKKAALASTGLLAVSLFAIPFVGTASAATPATTIGDNDAINVQTEYNCTMHTVTADVTNKLNTDINPVVSFEKLAPDTSGNPPNGGQSTVPIKPGEHQRYTYSFSGNNLIMPIGVAVDGYSEVEVGPMLNCQEPVSFRVTDYGQKMVSGMLANNNSTYPQIVTLTGPDNNKTTITLGPSESQAVSVSFDGTANQQFAYISVSNGPDYESSYIVDLHKPMPMPPVPLPGPKQ